MTAPEPNNDTANKSPGTTRRRFLGAAASLGLLGTVPTSAEATPTVTHGRSGTAKAQFPTRTGTSYLDVWLPDDKDASLDVTAYDYDDEHGDIELDVGVTGAHLTLNLTAAEAHDLAADLDNAARRITDGSQ